MAALSAELKKPVQTLIRAFFDRTPSFGFRKPSCPDPANSSRYLQAIKTHATYEEGSLTHATERNNNDPTS